jgi:hypothetical protein
VIDVTCYRCQQGLKAKGGVLLTPPTEVVGRMVSGSGSDTVEKRHLCTACAADVVEFIESGRGWEDATDEWTELVAASHPSRSESHAEWGVAMQMVSHRHSKGKLGACELVARIQKKDVRASGRAGGAARR